MTKSMIVSGLGAALLLVALGLGGCEAVPLPNSLGRGVPRQDGPLSVPPSALKTIPATP